MREGAPMTRIVMAGHGLRRCLARAVLAPGVVALSVALLVALLVPCAEAQAPFPNRPIRVLVTIPPGGAPDISARLIAQHLGENLNWSVVIENRPGANGNIAAEQVAKSATDGYTLLLHADSGIVINPHVYARLPFDPLKDLLPVAIVAGPAEAIPERSLVFALYRIQ